MIEQNTKVLFFVVLAAAMYLYLADTFSKDNFKSYFTEMVRNITSKDGVTHTFVKMINNYTNFFSAYLSASVSTFLYYLPVRFDLTLSIIFLKLTLLHRKY